MLCRLLATVFISIAPFATSAQTFPDTEVTTGDSENKFYLNECNGPECIDSYLNYDYGEQDTLLIALYSDIPSFLDNASVGSPFSRYFEITDINKEDNYYSFKLILTDELDTTTPIRFDLSSGNKVKQYLLGIRTENPLIEQAELVVLSDSIGKVDQLDFSQPADYDANIILTGKHFYRSLIVDHPSFNVTTQYVNYNKVVLTLNIREDGPFPYSDRITLRNTGNENTVVFEIPNIPPPPSISQFSLKPIPNDEVSTLEIKGEHLDNFEISDIRTRTEGVPDIDLNSLVRSFNNASTLRYNMVMPSLPSDKNGAEYLVVISNEFGQKDSTSLQIYRNQSQVSVKNLSSEIEGRDGVIFNNRMNTIEISIPQAVTAQNDFQNYDTDALSLYFNNIKVDSINVIDSDQDHIIIEFTAPDVLRNAEVNRQFPGVEMLLQSENSYNWVARTLFYIAPTIHTKLPKPLILRPTDQRKIVIEGKLLDGITALSSELDVTTNSSLNTNQSMEFLISSNEMSVGQTGVITLTDNRLFRERINYRIVPWQAPEEYVQLRMDHMNHWLSDFQEERSYEFIISNGLQFVIRKDQMDPAFDEQKFEYRIMSRGEVLHSESVIVDKNSFTEITIPNEIFSAGQTAVMVYKTEGSSERRITLKPKNRWLSEIFILTSLSAGIFHNEDGYGSIGDGIGVGMGRSFGNGTHGWNVSLNLLDQVTHEVEIINNGQSEVVSRTKRHSGPAISAGYLFKEKVLVNLGYDFRQDGNSHSTQFGERFFFMISAGFSLDFSN